MGRKTVKNKLTSPELIAQINPENMQLKKDFLDYLRSIQRSEGTIRGYSNDLDIVFTYMFENCNNKSFVKLTKREIVALQNWLLSNNGNSPARVRRIKAAMSSLSNYIENILDDEYEDYRPIVRKIENPANIPAREKSVFTTDEVEDVLKRLVDDGKYQVACALALAVYSGRRKAELARFKVDYFKPEHVIYDYFYVTPEKILTKGNKYIDCYTIKGGFDPYLSLWLKQREQLSVNSEWLFVTRGENGWAQASVETFNSWANIIGRYCDKPFYFHAMRHLFVSNLVRDGMSDSMIVEVVGWANATMIPIYNDIPTSEGLATFFEKKKESNGSI